MKWRTLMFGLLVIGMALAMAACLPEDASPDDNPIVPVDTSDNEPPDTTTTPTGPFRSVPVHGFDTETPSFLHLTFPVVDDSGHGIPDLTLADMNIYEDGLPISPSETAVLLRRTGELPYTIFTVVLIDNSLSLEGSLEEIKQAAMTLVNARLPQQWMAVIQFSEEVTLLQTFTQDDAALTAAVNGITPGYGGTNLYGAMVAALAQWEDAYDLYGIEQGFLIVFTDGRDTAGRRTDTDVLLERGEKRVFTVGLGTEIDEESLDKLGNSGYYPIAKISQLNDRFIKIQQRIVEYTQSFYWLTLQSPKRGLGRHTLEVRFPENSNITGTRGIDEDFESGNFYGLPAGVYVNSTPEDHDGLETTDVLLNSNLDMRVQTMFPDQDPEYEWSTDSPELFQLAVNPTWDDSCRVSFLQEGEGDVTVRDLANDWERTVTFVVSEMGPPRALGR